MRRRGRRKGVLAPLQAPTTERHSMKPIDSTLLTPQPVEPSEREEVRLSPDPAGRGSAPPHLVDHGGRVLKHVDVAPVYLGAYWDTAAGKADRTHNDAALGALVKDPGMTGVWKQYGAGSGTTRPSVTLSTLHPQRLTAAQLESLLRQQISAGRLDTSNRERLFTLVLPPGCELVAPGNVSSYQGMGGYHGSITVNGHEVCYAAIAYSQRGTFVTNGVDFTGRPRDDISIAESHEVTEAVTDPDVQLAMRTRDASKLGWYDDVTPWSHDGARHRGLGEIGDIPVTEAELRGASLSTTWGRVGDFAFQKEWSNQDGRAELAPEE
jgi:hypothetical protein